MLDGSSRSKILIAGGRQEMFGALSRGLVPAMATHVRSLTCEMACETAPVRCQMFLRSIMHVPGPPDGWASAIGGANELLYLCASCRVALPKHSLLASSLEYSGYSFVPRCGGTGGERRLSYPWSGPRGQLRILYFVRRTVTHCGQRSSPTLMFRET